MRGAIYALVAFTFLVAFLLWAFHLGSQVDSAPVPAWVAFCAMIVSVATLSSIAFAVITYLETSVLRVRIESAKKEIENHGVMTREQIDEVRRTFFAIADQTLKALQESPLTSGDSVALKTVDHNLMAARIGLCLALGTKESIQQAAKVALEISYRRFLDLEPDIWAKSAELPPSDRDSVRGHYQRVKELVLNSIKKHLPATTTT